MGAMGAITGILLIRYVSLYTLSCVPLINKLFAFSLQKVTITILFISISTSFFWKKNFCCFSTFLASFFQIRVFFTKSGFGLNKANHKVLKKIKEKAQTMLNESYNIIANNSL